MVTTIVNDGFTLSYAIDAENMAKKAEAMLNRAQELYCSITELTDVEPPDLQEPIEMAVALTNDIAAAIDDYRIGRTG